MSATVLVIGASRGLGLEFVRQYAAAGWRVIAGLRGHPADPLPEGVGRLQVDVLDPASISAMDRAIDSPLELVVICAGLFGVKRWDFEAPPASDFETVMATNVLGPIRLIEALAPRVCQAAGTIAVLTSRMGSISSARDSFGLLYRCSKAAANMVVKCAAQTYGPKRARIIALHPGWVGTAMGGPEAPLAAPEAIAGLRAVIADAQRYQGGGFYDYRGQALPW